MRSIVTTLLILGTALGWNPSYADCWPEVCWTCNRPSATDADDDGVPDQLEYDLAHKYFPHILLQHLDADLEESYLHRGWSIPYTVAPRTTGLCNEDRECLEIRYGIAYRYDRGDSFWGDDHLGDSEFYVALVMRTTSWSTASYDTSYWHLIRDFTAAHWGGGADSSVIGAYGYCPPNCRQWDNDGTTCTDEDLCHYFEGRCLGMPDDPWDSCLNYWEEDPCEFAGCEWFDPKCEPPSQLECYSQSPVSEARTLYAAEGKHALYHTDSECDSGGITDNCPYNRYDMHDFKSSNKLQNIGQDGDDDFDTTIRDPNGCDLYYVWMGYPFGEPHVTPYRDHFLFNFSWNLPSSAPPPTSGNPFSYANARDQFLACYGMAGRISSNCRDISDFDDKQMCYSMSRSTQSYCTQMTDRNLQLACYGMSINWPSNCRDITDQALKNFCYGVSGNNSSKCNYITNTNTQLLCLALATDNSSHCSGISSSNDRQFCYGVSSLNNYYCASIQ